MTASWKRLLKFDKVNNFRDYGGWRAADGTRVVTGKLFRSAHHARATAADIDRLGRLGIATVTDLRHPGEQREQPSTWIGTLAMAVIEAPAADEDMAAEAPHMAAFRTSNFSRDAMRDFMTSHYGEMPFDPRHITIFARYFDALASQEGGMLIHCAAGKDRTGILAWLTHHILGVHPDDAMEDYLLSNQAGNIADRLPHLRRHMEESYKIAIPDEAMQALLSVDENYIKRCSAALSERSGSIDGYLAERLGVDAPKREKICRRLLS
jgi:protein-tyrosine phosphatase